MIKHLFISFCLLTMASMSLYADEPSVKISLGIRDAKYLQITNVALPLAFRIENTGKTAIKSDHIADIFAKGRVHILPSDGKEQHNVIGSRWVLAYGLVPNDLQPGETSECSIDGDVFTFFPSTKDGVYEVWWTLGDSKSNILHFTVVGRKLSKL